MVFFMAEYRKKLEADIRCPLEYGLWWQMEIAYYMRAFRQQIPPRVEYSLTGKGNSVVPILQSICRWSDIFYKEDVENEMKQCQKCDYHR